MGGGGSGPLLHGHAPIYSMIKVSISNFERPLKNFVTTAPLVAIIVYTMLVYAVYAGAFGYADNKFETTC